MVVASVVESELVEVSVVVAVVSELVEASVVVAVVSVPDVVS